MSRALPALVLTAGAVVMGRAAADTARRSSALGHLAPPTARGERSSGLLAALRTRDARRRGHAEVRRQMPIAVELLRVAVSAGATPVHAVELLAAHGPPAVAVPMRAVVRALDLGESFRESLALLRGHPGAAPLADALDESASLGAPVEETLARLAGDLRAEARRAAQERARTVPVRLLFPLVALVLPAFGLLGIAPSLIAGASG